MFERKIRVAEVPRLRNRFRDQRVILGGNFRNQARTVKRFNLQMADELGLSEDDYDPARAYETTAKDLKLAAIKKEERQINSHVSFIQHHWRITVADRLRSAQRRRVFEAAVKLQRWWRRWLRMIRPLRECVGRREVVLAATLLIQRVTIGFITRRRLATRLQLHRVESEMQLLQSHFKGRRRPLIRLQAAVRGWLAMRKRQRLEPATASLLVPTADLRTDADASARQRTSGSRVSFLSGRRGTSRARRSSDFGAFATHIGVSPLSPAEVQPSAIAEDSLEPHSLCDRCAMDPMSRRIRAPIGAHAARMGGIQVGGAGLARRARPRARTQVRQLTFGLRHQSGTD